MLEPLSGKLTTDESKFNGVLEQLTAEDGNYYAVPFRSDFWVVYYNKDIFDQAGVEYPTNDMTMADFDARSARSMKRPVSTATSTTPGVLPPRCSASWTASTPLSTATTTS